MGTQKTDPSVHAQHRVLLYLIGKSAYAEAKADGKSNKEAGLDGDAAYTALKRRLDASLELLAASEAVAVMPWGYCVCANMTDMQGKTDDEHAGECRDLRRAIRKARATFGFPVRPDSACPLGRIQLPR